GSNAMVALGRLRYRPALEEAARLLQMDPQGECPAPLRAASAFAVGLLSAPGKPPEGVNLFGIYENVYEAKMTKFEAIKAVGNLAMGTSSDRLKTIAETESSPELRWIAHWSYERCTGTRVPYTPPTEHREPPVSISE